jgi:hypothetical protein
MRLKHSVHTGACKRCFLKSLIGFSISLCNIVIHALVMTAVVQVVHIAAARHALPRTWHMVAVMIATVAVLMFAHASEVVVWSLAYAAIGAAPDTTLGYGDVVPDERWRLIGPITAMNGHARVRLVDRRHLRSAAKDNDQRPRLDCPSCSNLNRAEATRGRKEPHRTSHTVMPGSRALASRSGSRRRRSVLRS